jgi:hypothetical protein
MSYQDKLKPFKMSEQICLYRFKPNYMSKEQAQNFCGHVLAAAVWNMIEPSIMKDGLDFRELLAECYPDYLGAAIALGCEEQMFTSLGLYAHDVGHRVIVANGFGHGYKK